VHPGHVGENRRAIRARVTEVRRDKRGGQMLSRRPFTRAWLAVALPVAVLSAACGATSTSPTTAGGPSASRTNLTPTPTRTPTGNPSTSPSPTVDCSAQTALARMTDAQRVGQLFTIGLLSDRLEADAVGAIQRFHFGSVWFTETSNAGVGGIRAVADAVQALATRPNTARVRSSSVPTRRAGLSIRSAAPGSPRSRVRSRRAGTRRPRSATMRLPGAGSSPRRA
jgi:hypothetical protein